MFAQRCTNTHTHRASPTEYLEPENAEPTADEGIYPSPSYYYNDQVAAQNPAAPARTYEYEEDKAIDPNVTSSPGTSSATGQPPSVAANHRNSRINANSGPFFNPTKQLCNLYSLDKSRSYGCRLTPRIDRGFFLSDSDWTCYRRNYFQVSISYTAVDSTGRRVELPCLVELEGRGLRTVTEFLVGVMARTSNGSREIELIQHTAKRDKGPQLVPQPRTCFSDDPTASYGIPIDQDQSNAVVFERLQFKSATANNGKRRAAQQYHVVFAELLAKCDDGCIARVASTESAPLVVRGRAPGHYANMGQKTGFEEGEAKETENEYSIAAASDPHHMSYTAYPTASTGAPAGTQSGWSGDYYHSQQYYAEPSVWANAAAASHRTDGVTPYEYDGFVDGGSNSMHNISVVGLPTPASESPVIGDDKRIRPDEEQDGLHAAPASKKFKQQ